ncbi:MAG: MOSC domain-containing protein, partial [Crocinitomicaceae bacterium]|nr:MOSC domain-containing protein [Crocinitomicaceae bacterium]
IIANYGVEGDRHAGEFVQHIFDQKKNPTAPNLRQVHLIHKELFDAMKEKGFDIQPGEMGENVTTVGINLLELPRNTILHLGNEAQVQITGLRKPCHQINNVQKGLLNEMVVQDDKIPYLTGVMAIALKDGEVKPGDEIRIEYPDKPYLSMEAV